MAKGEGKVGQPVPGCPSLESNTERLRLRRAEEREGRQGGFDVGKGREGTFEWMG